MTATALSSPALRRVQRVGIPIGAVLLTLLFVAIGFPYDRLRDVVAAKAGQALGAQIRMTSLAPAVSLAGPGVAVTGLAVTLADGRQLAIEKARVRPAWSPAWLRGRPALHVDVEAAEGHAVGTLVLGAEPGFAGTLSDVDLAKLPVAGMLPGLSLDGTANGDVDLRTTPAGPRGTIDLAAHGGSVALPGLPVALPFETLTARAELSDASLAGGVDVDLQGPMLTARLRGNVGRAPVVTNAPLDLQLQLAVVDPSLRPMLAGTGLRLAQDGSAEMRLTGSVGRPLLR
ncbi:MAG: type II secretion system protein GspN [Deltaproteobacteria bacterium]|nr:type II secretion system protein GspN [Deltaproteobacteria bacterium]